MAAALQAAADQLLLPGDASQALQGRSQAVRLWLQLHQQRQMTDQLVPQQSQPLPLLLLALQRPLLPGLQQLGQQQRQLGPLQMLTPARPGDWQAWLRLRLLPCWQLLSCLRQVLQLASQQRQQYQDCWPQTSPLQHQPQQPAVAPYAVPVCPGSCA